MLESVFLLLAVIGVAIIVIMACIRGYSDKVDENTLKALIIFVGVCMVLASIMERLSL